MSDQPSLIVEPPHTLTPCDAVAAIITVEGRYLMQLRDPKPNIFYPGHWGLFGGGMEPGESEVGALVRELDEEIGLRLETAEARRFTALTFDFAYAGGPQSMVRGFYEIELDAARLEGLQIHEGREMRLLGAEEVLDPARLVAPYDAFALWMHVNRDRIAFGDG